MYVTSLHTLFTKTGKWSIYHVYFRGQGYYSPLVLHYLRRQPQVGPNFKSWGIDRVEIHDTL